MASSIDNAFITQYGRRKPKMPQKRTRVKKVGVIVVPKEKKKENKTELKKRKDKARELNLSLKATEEYMMTGKLPKKKKEKKKSPVQTLLYKGRPIGSRKRSVSV